MLLALKPSEQLSCFAYAPQVKEHILHILHQKKGHEPLMQLADRLQHYFYATNQFFYNSVHITIS